MAWPGRVENEDDDHTIKHFEVRGAPFLELVVLTCLILSDESSAYVEFSVALREHAMAACLQKKRDTSTAEYRTDLCLNKTKNPSSPYTRAYTARWGSEGLDGDRWG
jgi:hypothetical protein